MKYFVLREDKEITNPIVIEKIDNGTYMDGASGKEFMKAPKMIVSYYQNSQEIEKPDVLYSPAFLVSEPLRKLLLSYDSKIRFKGIRCYPRAVEDPEALLYWWPYLKKIDCMSKETEKYPTGFVKKLVIEEKKIQNVPIFMVGGLLETVIVVSMELAESMLRRNMWGMEFESVAIKD
ncbi:MAG: imm11 family protein [Lachnospiraceae bacterium]